MSGPEQARSVPVQREPCRACGGTRQVKVVLHGTQARAGEVLTRECAACPPAEVVMPSPWPPRLAATFAIVVITALLAQHLNGTALGAAWLTVTAVICWAARAWHQAAVRRARRAGHR